MFLDYTGCPRCEPLRTRIPRGAAVIAPSAPGSPGKNVQSAAADWSRFPLGTKFRIIDTNEVFQIDDYGTALVGTDTIDLYKTNRLAMRKWGVRHVDIDILQWGSESQSLQILGPRARNRICRRMILALQDKARTQGTLRTF